MSQRLITSALLFILFNLNVAWSQEDLLKEANLKSNLFFVSDPTPLKDNQYSKFQHSLISTFSMTRIAVIKAAQNVGSAVLLGFSNDKKEALFATNYHVVAGTETVLVSFSFMTGLNFPSNKITCINLYDICIVSIKTDRMESLSFFHETLNLPALNLIPSTKLNSGDKIAYVSNMGRHSIYSIGEISQMYSNLNDFKDRSFVMMSSNAYFRTGMSGGAVINENGELIGLVSFYKLLDSKTNIPISSSYFLPTEWIVQTMQIFEGVLPKFADDSDLPLWDINNPKMPSYLKKETN